MAFVLLLFSHSIALSVLLHQPAAVHVRRSDEVHENPSVMPSAISERTRWTNKWLGFWIVFLVGGVLYICMCGSVLESSYMCICSFFLHQNKWCVNSPVSSVF